jgi:hypothetical protein
MADEGLHVVVTIADNGVIHAWGEGPVVGNPEQVKPFATRTRARAVAAQFRREEKTRLELPGETGTMQIKVCKVMGIEPVEVKVQAGDGPKIKGT